MKHKNGFNPLSRNASHRRAMHRNMVTSLFKFERVTTTQPKALEVRRTAEKLITRAKVDTVHNRRQVARFIADPAILAKLFTDIGPRMKDRAGGYTRVLKLGFRITSYNVCYTKLLRYTFYDLNTKINYMPNAKNRLFFSLYSGYDNILSSKKDKEENSSMKNKQKWGNTAVSFRWNHLYGSKLFSNRNNFV